MSILILFIEPSSSLSYPPSEGIELSLLLAPSLRPKKTELVDLMVTRLTDVWCV